jgi:hypothetical protein
MRNPVRVVADVPGDDGVIEPGAVTGPRASRPRFPPVTPAPAVHFAHFLSTPLGNIR